MEWGANYGRKNHKARDFWACPQMGVTCLCLGARSIKHTPSLPASFCFVGYTELLPPLSYGRPISCRSCGPTSYSTHNTSSYVHYVLHVNLWGSSESISAYSLASSPIIQRSRALVLYISPLWRDGACGALVPLLRLWFPLQTCGDSSSLWALDTPTLQKCTFLHIMFCAFYFWVVFGVPKSPFIAVRKHGFCTSFYKHGFYQFL